jgi:hypothetical protein
VTPADNPSTIQVFPSAENANLNVRTAKEVIMSQAVVITGMHRSGTSLVASLLQSAGIHVGDSLMSGNAANPRGFFEDLDFYEFQEHLLHDRGQTYLHIKDDFTFEPTPAETDRARQLLDDRSQRSLWGWKDPRTSLFLPFWQQLLPDARFVFVYRHPIEVLLSLVRRGEFDSHPAPINGLRAWLIYNANIRRFCEQHRERCLLAHIESIVESPEHFSQILGSRLHISCNLSVAEFRQIYHPDELKIVALSPEVDRLLQNIYPELMELYEWLNSNADLPATKLRSSAAAAPTLSNLLQFHDSRIEPLTLPVRYSLLQLLLSVLAPEHVERMLVRFSENAQLTQQTIDYAWLQVHQTNRANNEQRQELDRLALQIAMQQQDLKSQTEQIEALTAELNSIYGTRIGRVARSYVKLKERWSDVA